MVLDAMRGIKGKYTDVHITGGLSSISYGLLRRKIINRTFVALMMAAWATIRSAVIISRVQGRYHFMIDGVVKILHFLNSFLAITVFKKFFCEVVMIENLYKIHNASMRILETAGMRFQHPKIIELLREKGIRVDGETAYFKENQLMGWVEKAPKSFTVHARNSENNFVLGGDNMVLGPAYGAPYMIDRDGRIRKGTLDDYIRFLKLVHCSDYFQTNGGILIQPSDLDNCRHNLELMIYNTLLHSDKALIGIEGSETQMSSMFDMLAFVFDGREKLAEKPRIMTIVNTLSPLQMDRNALDTLIAYASHGQPVFVTPAPMEGFTAPITIAGMMALSNAEALAGIAVTQMIREGVPVVYGNQATSADLRTGAFVVGGPEHPLAIMCGARLAKSYGLPCRSGGSTSDAKKVCVQSGYESMMLLQTCSQENVNMVLLAGGGLDSGKGISFDKFMVDLEVIGLVRRLREGVRIDDDSLALDVITEVGPGGQFITSSHTARLCRQEIWNPQIGARRLASGQTSYEAINDNIDKRMTAILEKYEQPRLSGELAPSLTEYLISRGVDNKYLRV
ncbi:trimethylamine methyltransferase family protein [Desulforhopalus singaporensis]|uniref:Methyltransferase n=1 Tax=Desulforhopalus singaporensis TaxID=91360 RepID=A0A1H0VYN2_9BACT|nr:trimethylamine methyltransferase family protein [Desulforhopalus singaporensis]SDP83520.1 trimethylamine---corrinoid protein Co-methyltransferase [Desulforhopalus singaporensis]